MGRHRGPEQVTRRPHIRPTPIRIAAIALAALGLTVCSIVGIGNRWAPDGRAATSAPMPFPTADRVDDPGARGGPIAPIFDDAPRYDPGKDGALIVDGLRLDHPRSTGSTATRTTRTTAPPEVASPVAPPATTPPPAPPVIVEPPRDCADPLVECACDHDVDFDCEGNPRTPVGLPPVIVEEEPVVDEEPAEEPPADEDPVVDIGILTPDPAETTP